MKRKQLKYLTRLGLMFLFLTLLLSCSKDKHESSYFEPEESLKEADTLISNRKFEKAREILEDIKAKDASQKYATVARLRIADTYFEDGSYEEAAVEYESFLTIHNRHRYASYAQFKLAMSYFKRIKTVDVSYSWAKRALDEFERLLQAYPRNPYLDVTEDRIRTCRTLLADYELYVGKFYFKKKSYTAALLRLNNILKTYPDYDNESETLYYIGVSYNKLGQQDEAMTTLHSLISKYPASKISNDAKKVLASIHKKQ